jgi:hypothetical protein
MPNEGTVLFCDLQYLFHYTSLPGLLGVMSQRTLYIERKGGNGFGLNSIDNGTIENCTILELSM